MPDLPAYSVYMAKRLYEPYRTVARKARIRLLFIELATCREERRAA